MMSTDLEKKVSAEHIDTLKPVDSIDRHLEVTLPAALEGLSDDEIAELDKRATRKIDILLMPTLIILYVLNFIE